MYYSIMCSTSPRTTQASAHVPRSPGVVGFSNDSFNCYANAAIQALANCPPLIQLLKEEETRETSDVEQPGKLPEKFRRIILDIWSEKRNSSINLEELIETLRAKTKLFQKGFQHDSQEFIHFLMLLMNETEATNASGEISRKRFIRNDSGLGSLRDVSQCSSLSNEEDENDDKDDDGRRTEKQDADDKSSADAECGLERRDSGLELGSVIKKTAQNNLASIFESMIEITTRCHVCNKDSCVREVSETIRVPILSKATQSGAEDTPNTSVVTEQLAATVSPTDAVTNSSDAPASDGISLETAESLPQEVTAGQTLGIDSSSAETVVKPEVSVAESGGEDEVTSSNPANEESQKEIVKSNDAIGQEPSNLMRRVKSFGNFLCVSFCGPANSSSSPAVYEQLDGGRNTNRSSDWQSTLDICIDEMLKVETMDGENKYNCETCKQLTSASRKVKLLKLSEVLIFQLMRFTYEKGKVSKVQDRVQFPAVIDMTKHLPESSVGTDNGTRESSYELVAVICHQGSSNGGHYTTFAKNDATKLWHYFDDTRIAVVSFETVLRQQAYILFYKRL